MAQVVQTWVKQKCPSKQYLIKTLIVTSYDQLADFLIMFVMSKFRLKLKFRMKRNFNEINWKTAHPVVFWKGSAGDTSATGARVGNQGKNLGNMKSREGRKNLPPPHFICYLLIFSCWLHT